jgi:hypothetical protein
VAIALVGWRLIAGGADILLPFPPLLAEWNPHVGPGTPAALAAAGVVVVVGPGFAQRARWGVALDRHPPVAHQSPAVQQGVGQATDEREDGEGCDHPRFEQVCGR